MSNPRTTDTGGYNYRYFVKNVTDNLAEVEDTSLATGTCTNCFNILNLLLSTCGEWSTAQSVEGALRQPARGRAAMRTRACA